jgi:hypothetical protein
MTIGLALRFREASQGPAHRWWVLAAVECGNFVVHMDGFIVTLALPAMARQFGVGIHEIKWVLVAYLATLTTRTSTSGDEDRSAPPRPDGIQHTRRPARMRRVDVDLCTMRRPVALDGPERLV